MSLSHIHPTMARFHRLRIYVSLSQKFPIFGQSASLSSKTPSPPSPPGVIHPERVAKFQRIQAEFDDLLKTRAKKEAERAARPFYLRFKEMFQRYKGQFINVGAVFVCLCLAFQISVNRFRMKRLIKEKEERVVEMEEMARLMEELREGRIAEELAERCARVLVEQGVGKKEGFFRWRTPTEETTVLKELLTPVIVEKIKREISSTHPSESEKEEMELETLQNLASNIMSGGGERKTTVEATVKRESIDFDEEKEEGVLRKRKFMM